MIISRINKDLFRLALRYVKQRIPFRIYGDFAKRLVSQVKRLQKALDNPESITEFYTVCQSRMAEELQNAEDKPFSYRSTIAEKWETLIALSEECYSVSDLLSDIKAIIKSGTSNHTDGPLLCTAHRSKGLEAQRVYILNPHLFPHPKASTTEELIQERNLEYVAYTRSLDSLTLLS